MAERRLYCFQPFSYIINKIIRFYIWQCAAKTFFNNGLNLSWLLVVIVIEIRWIMGSFMIKNFYILRATGCGKI